MVRRASRAVSRRSLLSTAGAGVLALAVGGCGGSTGAAPHGYERTDDLEILNGALDVEHLAIAAYTAASSALSGELRRSAEVMLEQERAHAAALSGLVREMFGAPNAPRADYGLALRGERGALAFLVGVENTSLGYYVDALPKLSQPLRHVMASVLASDAEHLAVLAMARGMPAAGSAFVVGTA